MATEAVIFDLGNTLVSYFTAAEWPAVLRVCIAEVAEFLEQGGVPPVASATLAARVEAERRASGDLRVRPLEGRLCRIFGLVPGRLDPEGEAEMCRRFLRPVFATARLADDVHPTLRLLREAGLRTGIVSNTPWGSPAEPWRDELRRHRLLDAVDANVFCRDVGWRKPARQPFDLVLSRLGVTPGAAVFVGDHPDWDVAGPRALGMRAILIDRGAAAGHAAVDTIVGLDELLSAIR